MTSREVLYKLRNIALCMITCDSTCLFFYKNNCSRHGAFWNRSVLIKCSDWPTEGAIPCTAKWPM